MKHSKTREQKILFLRFLSATLIPALLLTFSVSLGLRQIYKQYRFTQKELLGVQATHLLFKALTDLQEIRGLSHMMLLSKTTASDTQEFQLRQSFKNYFITPSWDTISHELNLDEDVTAIMVEAAHLLEIDTGKTEVLEQFADFTAIIEKINSSILIVANHSNLILDPKLDTYYLVDTAIKQIPDLCEAFAIIRGLGSGMIAHGKSTKEEREFFRQKLTVMQEQLRKFNRVQTLIHESAIKTELFSSASELNKISSSFLQSCSLAESGQYQFAAQRFFQSGSQAIAVLVKTFDNTITLLTNKLKQRAAGQLRLMKLILVLSTLTFLIIFYFALSFYRLLQRSYRTLEKASITDPLTSIPNRRYLDITFDREIKRGRRHNKGIAFGMLDVDFFKKYNDTYGHHAGDIALKKVALSLKNSLQRPGDFYYRFGGEEFCFLFPADSLKKTELVGEKIRKGVQQLKIAHRQNSADQFLTISLGIIFTPQVNNLSLDDMIKYADALLYKAKDGGRNRCIAMSIDAVTISS